MPLQNVKVVSPLLGRSRPSRNRLGGLLRNPVAVRRQRRRPRVPRAEAERIVGIASTGHGASLTYLDASGVVRSSQLERWTAVKHMLLLSQDEDEAIRNPTTDIDLGINYLFTEGYGRFPDSRIFEDTIDPWREWLLQDLDVDPASIDLVVASDGHFATGWARLGPHLQRWFPNARVVRSIEHHEIHQRQAFWASGLDEAAVLTLDSAGDVLRRLRSRKLSGTISTMDRDGRSRTLREWLFPEMSSGALFDVATHHIGFRQGEEGKTMGLAAYGSPELFESLRGHLDLHDDGGFSFLGLPRYRAALERYSPLRRPGGRSHSSTWTSRTPASTSSSVSSPTRGAPRSS